MRACCLKLHGREHVGGQNPSLLCPLCGNVLHVPLSIIRKPQDWSVMCLFGVSVRDKAHSCLEMLEMMGLETVELEMLEMMESVGDAVFFHLHALILFLLYPHISHPQGTSLTPEVPAHQHNLLLSRAVLLFQTEAVPALRDVGVMIQCLGHVAHLHRFGILRSQVRHLSHHLALLTE